ncbi:MAG: DNA glycosylase [Candidatus Micrarchaeota archaeon]
MRIKARNFDLKRTVEGGQIFNYAVEDGHYYIIHSNSVIKISQPSPQIIEFETYPNRGSADLVKSLLNYNADYLSIVKKYIKNRKIRFSYEKYSGVKICQLEPWECLIGFICSQMNNIKRIRKMVIFLSEKFGDEVEYDGKKFHLFPSAGQLANADPHKLASCNLGYREKYLIDAAKAVSNGFDFQKLRKMDYAHAKRGLMMLPGIGEKVADCVLLFSLGFTEAFPVDVWIKRIMQKMYFKGRNVPENKIAQFARKTFGKDAAVVHEFLFANREELAGK